MSVVMLLTMFAAFVVVDRLRQRAPRAEVEAVAAPSMVAGYVASSRDQEPVRIRQARTESDRRRGERRSSGRQSAA